MGEINEHIEVSISVQSSGLTRAGFNTPMLVGYHTAWTERVRSFANTTELVAAGIPSTHPIYRMFSAVKAAKPALSRIKVGKRALAPVQSIRLTPVDTTAGHVISLDLRTAGGTDVTISRTNGNSETVATLATALTTAINASSLASSCTAADNTTHVTLTTDSTGLLVNVSGLAGIEQRNLTPDPGIATDLDAILAYDPDFFGVAIDSFGKAEITAAAGWCETNGKIFAPTTGDSDVAQSGSSDVASSLNTSGYHNTALMVVQDPMEYAGCTWLGRMFGKIAGAASWKYKDLPGISADTWTASQRAYIKAKKANIYTDYQGSPKTSEGWASSGRFMDITHGVAEFSARIGEDMFVAISTPDSVPFTDKGVSACKATLRGTMLGFARKPRNFITEESIDITAPLVADVSATDKSNRTLPDLAFACTGQGAIHGVSITGTVQF